MTRQAFHDATAGRSDKALRLLDGLPYDAQQTLERWLDALGELTPQAWLMVADGCSAHSADDAKRRIESIVSNAKLELTAWFIRDMVATATHATKGSVPRARAAANWAALAIALQSLLTDTELNALCAPFDAVIPRGALRLVQES